MTVRALVGLLLLNATLFLAGAGLLAGIRGFASWREFIRLSGLAYMLGLAAVGVALVIELVLGVPFGAPTVVATAFVLGAAGLVGGRLLHRQLPRRTPAVGPPLVAAAGAALAIVYLEALFRAGRLAQLIAWDGMAMWLPKGETIYFFDGLDERLFRELTNPSYPPLLPALEASAFSFMGSADTVTVHLQFWFALVGFVAAVAGVLAARVPAPLLWPPLVLVVIAPVVVERALLPLADLVLDYFVALAALLTAIWLVERARWQLVLAAVLLSAAMLTKREGYMFAVCIVAAALAVSWADRSRAWPRLGVAAVAAGLTTVPWQLWIRAHGIGGQGPEGGMRTLFDNLDRAWPSFELAVSTLFDDGFWLVVAPLAVIAVVLAFLAGTRMLPAYATLLALFATAGLTYSTWAWPEFPFTKDNAVNPISRVSGGLVLAFAGLLPLLWDAAWRGSRAERADP